MNNIEIKLTHARTVVSLLALALLAAGCAGKKEEAAGFATPEAAVAALVAALEHWPHDGVPSNPGAWLTTTAKRRALDWLRHRAMAAARSSDRSWLEALLPTVSV